MNRPLTLVVVFALLAGAMAFVGTLVTAPGQFDAAAFGDEVRRLASEHKWARVAVRARSAARQNPRHQDVLMFWALGDERSGNMTRAHETWERLLRVTQENVERGNASLDQWYYRGWALHGLGDQAGAMAAWRENAERRRVGLYNRTCYLSLAGRREEALAMWERLVESGEVFDVGWARVDPDLDPIRDDPRFEGALRRGIQRMRETMEGNVPV